MTNNNNLLIQEKSITSEKVMILIPLISGLFIRLSGIKSQSLSVDEGVTWFTSIKPICSIVPFMTATNEVHPPLYFYFVHFWLYFGHSEWVMRLSSLIFAIINIYLTYILGRMIYDRNTAFWGAMVLSFSSFNITYSQELRMYSLLTFLFLLSMIFFLRYLREYRLTDLVFSALINCIAFYTHYLSFLVPLMEFTYLLCYYKEFHLKIYKWLTSKAIIIILFVPWFLYYISHTKMQDFSLRFSPGFNHFIGLFSQMSIGPHLPPLEFKIIFLKINLLFLLGIITVLILTFTFFKISTNEGVLLYIYLMMPVVLIFSFSQFTKTRIFEYKYFLIVTPFLSVLFGAFIVRIKQKLALALFVIALLLLNAFSSSNFLLDARYGNQNWRMAANILQYYGKSQDVIIIHPSMMLSGFLYYYRGSRMLVPVDKLDEKLILEKLKHYKQIWLCTVPNHPYVKRIGLEKWLDKSFKEANYAIFPDKSYVPSNVILIKLYNRSK